MKQTTDHLLKSKTLFSVRKLLCSQVLLWGIILLVSNGSQVVQAENRLTGTIEDVLPCMVKIFGAGGINSLKSYGTGFLISPEGHFVTVWSHVLDTDRVRVVLGNGQRHTALIVDFDPQQDLAVLKLEGDFGNLPHVDLNDHVNAPVGTRVLAFSNMFKVATGDEPVSVMHGVIAAKVELDARRGSFQVPFEGPVYILDAPTNNSGAAGGLLTDYRGRLIGMIGKELRNSRTNTWVHYAMPIQDIAVAALEMKAGSYEGRKEEPATARNRDSNRTKPKHLGMRLVPNVVTRTPAYVDQVLSKSPAEEAGIQPDDLILFVNGQIVPSIEILEYAIAELEEFDEVKLILRRGDKILTVEFSVPEREEE